MITAKALMESVSFTLHSFLCPLQHNLTRPNQKFLRDGLVGLLRAGEPILCQMARHLPQRHTQYLSRLKRLDAHVLRYNEFAPLVQQNATALWAARVKDDTPLIVDLSDLGKPLARKMDYLALVRDGSTGHLVNGYWLLEIYAAFGRKNPFPVHLQVFSHAHPTCAGQNPLLLEAVHQVLDATQGRGILVMDRGGDGRVFYDDWLDQHYRFVVRLCGNRDLLRFYGDSTDGTWIPQEARMMADHTPAPHLWSRAVKHKGRVVWRMSLVGWIPVRLPGRTESLTMVVSRLPGVETSFLLLTNLPVETFVDAKRVLRLYLRRWECEEGIQFLKEQVHLEKIRTFRWQAICSLVLLTQLAMMYLVWLLHVRPGLCEHLIAFGQPLPNEPECLLYRLATGLTEVLHACFWLRRYLL